MAKQKYTVIFELNRMTDWLDAGNSQGSNCRNLRQWGLRQWDLRHEKLNFKCLKILILHFKNAAKIW